LEETAYQHGLLKGEEYDLIKSVEATCEDISDAWTDLVKKGSETTLSKKKMVQTKNSFAPKKL